MCLASLLAALGALVGGLEGSWPLWDRSGPLLGRSLVIRGRLLAAPGPLLSALGPLVAALELLTSRSWGNLAALGSFLAAQNLPKSF